ncbi:MAG: hypothetical protein KDK97_09320 [Verrucomicrobiales bacterium]|nr:hypothetical protein [Verrucomicrobiales bacterium]MCP5558912.1 hypothetical protein [Verrucomicrobiaceae bacterium]
MREGEQVLFDGRHILFRVQEMGTHCHYTYARPEDFRGMGDDGVFLLQEFVETMWWTPEHERQMRETLAGLGIELSPRAEEYLYHAGRAAR